MSLAWRIYQRLAQAFPHEFKLAYGAEVTQLGADVVEETARRHGVLGLIPLLADISVRVPLEYLSEMRGDMRYAWRALRKSPGFALVGIISMGLGIGLTTNVYSSKWKVLFRPLAGAANADRLVMMQRTADGDLATESYYYVEQYREQKSLFAGAAAFEAAVPFNVTFQGNLNGKSERVFGQLVSPDYFSVLGVAPQAGRVLSVELDRPGESPAVVVSDRFWHNRLNSSPDAVGQTLRVNGQIATIVGITPKGFNGAMGISPAEIFVPITGPAAIAPELANDVLHQRNARDFLPIMCLAPGVSIDTAESALDVITRQLDEQDTTELKRVGNGRRVTLLSAGTNAPLPRKIKPALLGFFVALMGLIIALACMNLANMLIARGANRRREVAIRLAVGASRFRLVRQMISEGILLSLLGGVAGFALAYVLGILNSHFRAPSLMPFENDFYLDWRAAVFAFGLAIVCGVAFSLAPALQATKADMTPALKEGSALQLPGYRRFGLRNVLMVSQVAASLMLLLLTGFLVIGLSKSSEIATKLNPNSVYLVSLDPVRDGYSAERAQALFEKLPEQLKSSGVVSGVALSAAPPYSTQIEMVPMTADGASGSAPVQQFISENVIGAGYFAALGESVLSGREFEARDLQIRPDPSVANALPAVLNESAARKLFGSQDVLGKSVRDDKRAFQIVGIVRDVKDVDGVMEPALFFPLTAQDFARPPASGIVVLARSDAGSDALTGIRNEIASIDPNLNLLRVETLRAYLDRSRAALRFSVQTYGAIGLFGLVLAAIGLAGVTAYAVAQRRKEIAIRMALGSSRSRVVRLVLREGAAMVAAGTILGFLGAIGLARIVGALASIFADALKFGTNDPRLLIGAPLLLAGVAILACFVPARRSTQIDPLQALREE